MEQQLSLKETIQNTVEYKSMDSFRATSIAEGFCGGEDATDNEKQAAWQWLHDTGIAYQLQGWFGRTATDLIRNGIIGK